LCMWFRRRRLPTAAATTTSYFYHHDALAGHPVLSLIRGRGGGGGASWWSCLVRVPDYETAGLMIPFWHGRSEGRMRKSSRPAFDNGEVLEGEIGEDLLPPGGSVVYL
jgi:hypothetical protein